MNQPRPQVGGNHRSPTRVAWRSPLLAGLLCLEEQVFGNDGFVRPFDDYPFRLRMALKLAASEFALVLRPILRVPLLDDAVKLRLTRLVVDQPADVSVVLQDEVD